MKKFLSFITISLILISCDQEKQKKVLIIGIDGARPDAVLAANTPNIDKLIAKGAYSFCGQTDTISSSGICWTGMLTGVWNAKHKVVSNAYKNPNIEEYPHFFQRIKEYNKDLINCSVVNWEPIHKIILVGQADFVECYSSDDSVTNAVVNHIKFDNPDAVFVQLDECDYAGHTYDYIPESPNYLKSLEIADIQVGAMITAIEGRPNYLNEDWMVIISTDHGGSNYGHGKNIAEHTTIFIIVSSNDIIKGQLKETPHIIDIAVTAMNHLGIIIQNEWNLDGKILGNENNR